MIQEIKTVAEYDAMTAENAVAVVHFGFKWNSFDRMMMRTLTELEAEFTGKIALGFLDIDQNATIDVLKQIKIVNVPTLAYFKNGEHLATTVGMRTMDDVRTQIAALISE
jgi:thioredoxin 1